MWLMKLKMLGMLADINKKETEIVENGRTESARETAELMLKIYEELHKGERSQINQNLS